MLLNSTINVKNLSEDDKISRKLAFLWKANTLEPF